MYALWTPQHAEARWRQRLTAAALWIGSSGAVSHRAAATVLELDGIDASPVELVTTARRRAVEPGLVVHRVRSLEPDDVIVHDGIRVTSAVRTLVDLCAVVDARAVELAFESALRRRLATPAQVHAALAGHGRSAPGGRVLRRLIHRFPGVAAESALEVHVWRLIVEAGLPLPVRQHEVRSERGTLVARIDLAYPELRIAIEADGHEFHSSRRDWQRDRTRQNALVRLGWIVYRVTWEDATRRPAKVVTDIATLLGPVL